MATGGAPGTFLKTVLSYFDSKSPYMKFFTSGSWNKMLWGRNGGFSRLFTLFKRHPEHDSMTHLYTELSSHSSPFSPSTSSSSALTTSRRLPSSARPNSLAFMTNSNHFSESNATIIRNETFKVLKQIRHQYCQTISWLFLCCLHLHFNPNWVTELMLTTIHFTARLVTDIELS